MSRKAVQPLSKRDVGEMGESRLKEWAAQEGIIANQVRQDKTGWDFLLELPVDGGSAFADNTPLDLVEGSLRCMVQIKSTDQQPNSWGIKLDNWERFVKNPLPCFFLFLEYDHKTECQRAYLVHVWEEHIRLVLRKLRELSPRQHGTLHKIKLSVPYHKQKQLSSLDGRGLMQAIREYIQQSPEEYARQKDSLVKNVGYEDGNLLFEMSVLPPDRENLDVREFLVDFAIGLVPHLGILHGQITDIRFGIRAPEPLHVFEQGGKFKIERQSRGPALIKLSTLHGHREIRIPAETYAPQIIDVGAENRHFLKYRLAAPNLDFVVAPYADNQCVINYEIPDPTETVKISDVRVVSEFIDFVNQTQQYRSADFEITFGDLPLGSGKIHINNAISNDLVEYATVVISAWKVLRAFDISGDTLVRVGQLLRQRGSLQLLGSLINGEGSRLVLEFTAEPSKQEISDTIKDNELSCFPFVQEVFIGEHRIIASMVAIGRLEPIGEIEANRVRLRMVTEDVRIRSKHAGNKKEQFRLTVEELIEETAQPFKDDLPIIRIRNFLS